MVISQVLPIIQALVKTALFMYFTKYTLDQRKQNDQPAATFYMIHYGTCTKRHRRETNAVELVQYEAGLFYFFLSRIKFRILSYSK